MKMLTWVMREWKYSKSGLGCLQLDLYPLLCPVGSREELLLCTITLLSSASDRRTFVYPSALESVQTLAQTSVRTLSVVEVRGRYLGV